MNIHGRITQVLGRGVGPGKGHLWDFKIEIYPIPFPETTEETLVKQVEDADWLPAGERLPKRTYQARKNLMQTPEGAIAYMAAAINAAARTAGNAGFRSIRKRPAILARPPCN